MEHPNALRHVYCVARPAGALSLSLLLFACGDDASTSSTLDAAPDAHAASDSTTADAVPDADASTADAGPDCDRSLRPIVAAHGFLASGDTWANHAMRFEANGLCPGWFVAFDWNSLDRRADHEAALDATIDALLADTGATQVDLFGHSAGGGLGYDFLSEPTRAAKVAHYVHIGSFANDGPAGPDDASVPTLNLWSPDDRAVTEGADIPGATNVSLPGADHYEVATNEAGFAAIHAFLYDAEPATTEPAPSAAPTIRGRALTFGENVPSAGATVDVWPLVAATGQRRDAEPAATLTATDDGRWGPVTVEANVPHELVVTDSDGGQVHYYREPFTASNPLVYLRTLPGPGSLAGALTSVLPLDEPGVVLIVFSSSAALEAGADSLTLDGVELSRDDTTDPDNTTIALFLFDANGNDTADGTTVAAFDGFPFLAGVDIWIDGDVTASSEVTWNDRTLRFPRWPADAHGAIVATFD